MVVSDDHTMLNPKLLEMEFFVEVSSPQRAGLCLFMDVKNSTPIKIYQRQIALSPYISIT